jgi:hypothetical protein
MDLKVLFGIGLCLLNILKKASVNIGWVRVETHSNILALGYTVLTFTTYLKYIDSL